MNSAVGVGLLDTGLNPVEAGARVTAFRRFDPTGFDDAAAQPFDRYGHGTRSAALIARGASAGLAPDCEFYAGAVIEEGNIVARILCGLAWLLECPVAVVCLPLGIAGPSPVFSTLLLKLRSRGVLPISAIGNGGAGRCLAPGSDASVLSVGAADADGRPLPFSGSAHRPGSPICLKPDLLAAADGVAGTSSACATVASLAARLFQEYPGASPGAVEAALTAACDPLPDDLRHRARHGAIRPEAVIECFRRAAGPPPYVPGAERQHDRSLPFVDPRLARQLAHTGEELSLAAVIESVPRTTDHPGGAAAPLVERVARSCGIPPARLHYVPGGNAAIVQAPAGLIRRLAGDSEVVIASAADADRALLLWS